MSELKVTPDQAEQEVTAWLDAKKIDQAQRAAYKENIEAIKDGISAGVLVLNEDKSIVHTLKFPVGNEEQIKAVTYKPRLAVKEVHKAMTGVKSNDADARLLAYASALTGVSKTILGEFDTVDWSITQSIVVFFA